MRREEERGHKNKKVERKDRVKIIRRHDERKEEEEEEEEDDDDDDDQNGLRNAVRIERKGRELERQN